MSVSKLELQKSMIQNGHHQNVATQNGNAHSVNGSNGIKEDIIEDLLFSSESVGEGHPGKLF